MTKVLTDQRSIRIKGRSFLAVVLSPESPVDQWLERLDDLAARSAGFFLSRPVVLDVSELSLDKAGLKELLAALTERNVGIMGIEGVRPSMIEPGMPPSLPSCRKKSRVLPVRSGPSCRHWSSTSRCAPASRSCFPKAT